MKNKLSRIPLIFFSSLIVFMSCDQEKKLNTAINQREISEGNFKLNKKADTSKFETIYNDGRKTAIRNLKYYNYLIQNNEPMQDAKLGLTTVTAEWNKYDGNLATPQGAFIEIPFTMSEEEKRQVIEGGNEPANSTMVGGDVETNRRIKQPAMRYWAVASKTFEQAFKNLKIATEISNRDTNYVTFDFITNVGFYTYQEKKSTLDSAQSVWGELFKESKFLNTEMARVQNESALDAEKRYKARQLKKIKK